MTSKFVHISQSSADTNLHAPSASTTKDPTARILKKRESDRRCQRIKRERTKSRIASLEERVRTIGNQDATGQVQLLIKQLQGAERDRDELAKKIKTIENFLKDGETEEIVDTKPGSQQDHPYSVYAASSIAGSSDPHPADRTGTLRNNEKKVESQRTDISDQVQPVLVNHGSGVTYNTSLDHTLGPRTGEYPEPFQNEKPHLISCFQHSQTGQRHCECLASQREITQQPRVNIWRFANNVLSSRFGWPEYCRFLQDEYRDDTPVRAIVEGWDVVEAFGSVHPSWQILKQLDQGLLRGCALKERLAVVVALQALLLSHIRAEPVAGLPSFYRVRPSQNMATMADSYAINFFPWPGMRERFAFNQHRYCTNEFWNAFLSGLRLTWPYEFRDVYTRNVETGLYAVSPMFQHHVSDISCWTMDIDVFKKWPELAADIPAYNRLPRSMSNWVRVPRSTTERKRQVVCVDDDNQQEANSNLIPQPQPSQPYVLSEATPAAVYYSPAISYNINQETAPVIPWAEATTQQPHEAVGYYSALPHSVNVTSAI